MNAIITGANAQHFSYLELFVHSLRNQGEYNGIIAVCDNWIEGEWDKPGKFRNGGSFSPEQLSFLNAHDVRVFPYSELLIQNGIDRSFVDSIPSQTQRYPHKFIYCTLLSKYYLDQVDHVCYFDADMYFQKPIQPLFDAFSSDSLHISGERLKIGESPFLSKWIAFSDFSALSDQELFIKELYQSLDFCSGFFGGEVKRFHSFCLLCTLLTSTGWINFYSDQPLVNIMKTWFYYPFNEMGKEFVFHLGEFHKEDFVFEGKKLKYFDIESMVIHFNGPNKDTFETIRSRYFDLKYNGYTQYSKWKKLIIKATRQMKIIKSKIRRAL